MTMDIEQLLEIEKRSEAATRGPWQVHRSPLGEKQIGTLWDHPQLKGPLAVVTMSIHAVEPKHRVFITENDAEFIANARMDIPYLIEEVKRLREEKSRLQIKLNGIRGSIEILSPYSDGQKIDRIKYILDSPLYDGF